MSLAVRTLAVRTLGMCAAGLSGAAMFGAPATVRAQDAASQQVPAQEAPSIHPHPPPFAHAARRVGPVVIDGRLDDPAWAAATPITAFTQVQPADGVPATQRTEVRFLYDADAIYIGARMYDSLGRHGVRGRLIRRDQQLDLDNNQAAQLTSDKLTIILDPYHDHLTRAVFEVNPSGVKGDALGPAAAISTRPGIRCGMRRATSIPLAGRPRFGSRSASSVSGLEIRCRRGDCR